MIPAINENKYNMSLIFKVKKQTGPKKLEKIVKNLKNLEVEDLKEFSELKVKILEEEKKDEKKIEIKVVAPIFGYKNYIEDYKKSNSIVNSDEEIELEDTPSTINEEEKQIDSSDFSEDE